MKIRKTRSGKNISPRSTSLTIAAFNAQWLGTACKHPGLCHFIHEHNVGVSAVSETWFQSVRDEVKCRDIAPPGHRTFCFPRRSRGGEIAFIINSMIMPYFSSNTSFPFPHAFLNYLSYRLSFHVLFHLFCLFRPPPSSENVYIEEFPELLTLCNTLKGSYVVCGDFNFHYDQPTSRCTARLIDVSDSFGLVQSVRVTIHRCGIGLFDGLTNHGQVCSH